MRVINGNSTAYNDWAIFNGLKTSHVFTVACFSNGDRGGAVVKVLCYKSKGRWFDPSWCHSNLLLT